MALRRRLLDSPTASGHSLRWAENPLDLLWHRGLISQSMHEAAGSLRRLYLAAFPSMPDMASGRIDEAPGEESKRRVDRSTGSHGVANLDGNPHAMAALRDVWAALRTRPLAQREVLGLCLVVGRWPAWVEKSCGYGGLSQDDYTRRAECFAGLTIIARTLSGAEPKAA